MAARWDRNSSTEGNERPRPGRREGRKEGERGSESEGSREGVIGQEGNRRTHI